MNATYFDVFTRSSNESPLSAIAPIILKTNIVPHKPLLPKTYQKN
jgi:hypothetical protein